VHDLCDELGLRCQVDITAGAARAWTNVDDRKHESSLRSGRTRRSESGKKLRGVWDSNWPSPSNPLISLKLNRRWRSEKCWLGVRDDFRTWFVQSAA
jgi:hypothetical protein